ncbi:ABC transporter substrate-binding protein [Pseudonocardia endophytica]|uniref:Peptide/nickel transport system substrate-binding protein n=1 Tax=Pseudonocardia endophytica TaxID=401976 RepID=A0A4R1HYC1_PSEEN|nr:ABC transporter substrate-binding protein [Pseudonocardia endophytica]TCK27787.1 peptide/nickel transport system substrate-binding protein [Pseudonocardia endophytica]
MVTASRPRTRARVALACAAVGLLAACGGGGSGTGVPVPDGRITVAAQFSPDSGYGIDTDDAYVLSQLGVTESLVASGTDGVARPRLATAWNQVDPRTWRFTLRHGVVFQDGTPLNPAAVARSLTWLAGVSTPPRAIKGVGLAVVPDGADGVRVTTTNPDPILPLRLSAPSTGILAPSAYAATPPKVQGTGTGPMTITAANGTQSAELARNDRYWGERPTLSGVTVNYVSDPAARALALRAGDADIAQGLPESSALEFTDSNGYTNQTVAAPRTDSLLLNQSAAPFDDPRVRQAVTAAIDRTALAEQALAGSAVPASELFGPAVPWGSSAPPPAADVERAKSLLAQAGYGPGRPLQVTLATYPNRPELPTLATAIQAMLRGAGIEATIRVGDYDADEPDLLAGKYQMYILSRSYLTDVADAGATLSTDYTCQGSYNINSYCSPQFDAIVAPLATQTDAAQRQDGFRRAAEKLNADAVGVPLVHTQVNGVGRQVAGYAVDPLEQSLVTPGLATTQ